RAKIETIATEVYRARKVHFERPAAEMIDTIEGLGFAGVPVCMAKTQMSLTDTPKLRGAPEGFEVTVNEVTLSAGAGFVVARAGNIVVMPGLPKVPAAERVKIDEEGNLLGMAGTGPTRAPPRGRIPRPSWRGRARRTSRAPSSPSTRR